MKTVLTTKKIGFILILMMMLLLSPSDYFAQNSYTINTDNGKNKISIKNSKTDFKVEYEGEIILADDDLDIKSISKGGYIEIKKSSFGRKRKIIIENNGGTIIRKFYVGWSEKNYYPEGKEWLEDILPEILRTTTIGAKSRVDRFYKNGGTKEVLAEIGEMDSDYVQSVYFKLLLEKNISTTETVQILQSIKSVLKSDHYLSSILRKNQDLFLKTPETINAFIAASKNVGSDHYLTQIVKTVVSNKDISDSQLASLLTISKSINSDHYLSEVLKEVMNKRELNAQNVEQIMMLSSTIGSDHYKTVILKKALKNEHISKESYDSFLNSLNDINSDHYASEVIKEMMSSKLDTQSLTKVLEIIKKNVGSAHYATTIYKKMAIRNDFTEDQMVLILDAVGSMNSSHYLSDSLVSFAPIVKKSSATVKDAYIRAAKSINSETYFGKAMKAIY